VGILGTNIMFTMLIVGLTSWPSNARLTRAQVITLKGRAFVQAAVGAGASRFRVISHHILPNGMYPVIVNSSLQMANAILTEASLSFLGLGDPNQMSWGQILSRAQLHVQTAWWMAVFPGISILILVLSFNLVGEGINFVMNPRLRQRI
jgi:peptide/nickel transport system permease protein